MGLVQKEMALYYQSLNILQARSQWVVFGGWSALLSEGINIPEGLRNKPSVTPCY